MIAYGVDYTDERGEPLDTPVPAVDRADGADGADNTDGARRERGPGQAAVLRRLALQRYRFGRTDDGTVFAVPAGGPNVARLLRGGRGSLRAELAAGYAAEHAGRVPSQQALADALLALEGHAADTSPEHLALRVAAHGGALVLDLGAPDGRVVQIGPHGWQLLETSPVLFRRTALTGLLPVPARPGSLAPLRARLNVTDTDFALLLGWLVAALMPDMPHPVLSLIGEQGTGKSTAARLLVSMVDPSPAPLRAAPRDVESWAVTAAGSWLVALDNLSGIQPWLSDVLCRAVTGDGLVRRKLYTDDDLAVIAFRRVVILNGIDLGALRGDLADRLLAIELGRIHPAARQPEAAVDLDDTDRAQVLGALLTLTAAVLANLDRPRLAELPRMADFARILAALDRTDAGVSTALDSYLAQADSLAETVADADAFTTALRAFTERHQSWTGTASELLAALGVPDPRPRQWPATAQSTAAALRRAAPVLRQLGYTIEPAGRQAKTGKRDWHLAARGDKPAGAFSADPNGRGDKPGPAPVGLVTPPVTPTAPALSSADTGRGDKGDEGDKLAGPSSADNLGRPLDMLGASFDLAPVDRPAEKGPASLSPLSPHPRRKGAEQPQPGVTTGVTSPARQPKPVTPLVTPQPERRTA